MVVDDLLEKFNESMFKNIDFDEILDLRDSELAGYTDIWLEALIKTYATSKIPCGDI